MLLFVVLMYVYPLKFLFALLFSNGMYNNHGHLTAMITDKQQPTLMFVYHLGYAAIYSLFLLMYLHAQKKATELQLTPPELFETNSFIIINLFNAMLGITGMLLVAFLPSPYKGATGVIYIVIPLIYTVLFTIRGRQSRKLFGGIIEKPS
ncbi:MAG TPA: hypothetical protein VGN20_04100 [Mucilaginibacter sp.]|jgi:hypothetical protein